MAYENREYNVYGVWGDVCKYSNDILGNITFKEALKMPNTKIELILSGNGSSISNTRKTVNFDLLSKDEDVISLSQTDPWTELDISRIKNWRSFIIFSESDNIPFKVRITVEAERIIVNGMDSSDDDGLYFDVGIVNSRTKYQNENSSYIQWNSTLSRWEKYSAAAMLEAYSDNVLTPDLATWTKINSDPYALKIILFNAEPITFECRDLFSFFPASDSFMATVQKIELSTSNGTSTKFFVSSMGAS